MEGKDEVFGNGAEVFKSKRGRKRKSVVSSGNGENLVAGKRILRSDVAKQREREADEAKKKALEDGSNIGALDCDEDTSKMNGIDVEVNSFGGLKVQNTRVLRSSLGKQSELSKTQSKKFSKKDVVRDHESKEMEVIACEQDNEVESKNTLSSKITEKTKADETNVEKLTEELRTKEADMEAQDSDKRSDTGEENVICEEESKSAFCEMNGTEKKSDEVIKAECKINMDTDAADKEVVMVELDSEIGQKVNSVVKIRNKKVNISVENRRFTRSSAVKPTEEADTNKKTPAEKLTSEAVQTENNCYIKDQTCIQIEKNIAGSNICEKNITGGKIEAVKRRAMKLDVAKRTDGVDTNKKRKKFKQSGDRKISKKKSGVGTNSNKTKTGSYQIEEAGEENKLIRGLRKSSGLSFKEVVPSKRQNAASNDKRIKSAFKKGFGLDGENVKCQVASSKTKQNGVSSTSSGGENKVKDVGKGPVFPSNNKKTLGSTKSHIKEEKAHETGRGFESISQSKESKSVDASRDSRDGKENTTSQLAKKEGAVERRMAKQKLRDQIQGMLFNAGWRVEFRPRNGRSTVDPVYVTPKGCTHWSIVKAYYAFQKQFDSEVKHSPPKRYRKSQKSTCPSFTPIPEEALSILKRRIIRRRTNKEIEEARMKLGEGTTKKKAKKHIKYKVFHKKVGKHKGRGKKASIVGSCAKGALDSVSKRPLGKYRRKQKGNALLVRSFNQGTENDYNVYIPYFWKRTTLSWIIDSGIVAENAAVKYMNPRHTKALLEGQITRDGIHCSCCSTILTVSDFEIHAGSKQSKPYQNILVEGAGTSLSQCQINAWEKQDESERRGFYTIDVQGDDTNDDTCGICGDGGDLICCDGCPSTFHQSCLGTEMLPPGEWYCMNCSCRYCALSSGTAAQENGGIDSALLSCSQCEKKYHHTCVPAEDAVSFSSRRLCIPFCGQNCEKVFNKLRMLLGVKNSLDGGFSWTIVQRFDDNSSESVCTLSQRAECNSKVAVALAVMDECFLPIIDQRSGINLIHNVVYNCGSNFSRLHYSGFYTFILERNDEVISVASLRIHGTMAAEMPFIGTRNLYRRQGMCRRLLNEVESVLRSLNIEKLIIPAISELVDTWTNNFGFKLLKVSEKEEVRIINLLVFPGTGLLVKPLLEKDSIVHCKTTDEADQLEPEAANESIFPGSSEAHVEHQSPEFKSSENDAQKDLLNQHQEVSLDVESKFEKGSSLELEAKLTFDTLEQTISEAIEGNSKASEEDVLDANPNVEDQIATLQPNPIALDKNSGHCHTEIISRSVGTADNKLVKSSKESSSRKVSDKITCSCN